MPAVNDDVPLTFKAVAVVLGLAAMVGAAIGFAADLVTQRRRR